MNDRPSGMVMISWAGRLSALACVGGALLATDNALGFAGLHLFGSTAASFVAVATSAFAVGGIAAAVRAQDLARGLIATSALVFVLLASPALFVSSSVVVNAIGQIIAPLGLSAGAVLSGRGGSRLVRAASVITTSLAVAWLALTSVPWWLLAFVVVQSIALWAAAVLVAVPVFGKVAQFVRFLNESAEVR